MAIARRITAAVRVQRVAGVAGRSRDVDLGVFAAEEHGGSTNAVDRSAGEHCHFRFGPVLGSRVDRFALARAGHARVVVGTNVGITAGSRVRRWLRLHAFHYPVDARHCADLTLAMPTTLSTRIAVVDLTFGTAERLEVAEHIVVTAGHPEHQPSQ
jgi:hypothetical protein